MRKALSNLPPIFSGDVSTDVSGSFFTLPMTQRPLSTAFLISPFKNACDVAQEMMNKITATLTWKLLKKNLHSGFDKFLLTTQFDYNPQRKATALYISHNAEYIQQHSSNWRSSLKWVKCKDWGSQIVTLLKNPRTK